MIIPLKLEAMYSILSEKHVHSQPTQVQMQDHVIRVWL